MYVAGLRFRLAETRLESGEPVTVTIRTLLRERDLGLAVLTGGESLDQEIRWVAVSELPDPTPWLDGAELLLTSGMWLSGSDDRTRGAEAWACDLARAGTRAVGFGLRPWFETAPEEVVQAARHYGVTLLQVPPSTPFVAVDRRVADLRALAERREEAAVVRSQQRLVSAAQQGPESVVGALARELGGWVLVLDGSHETTGRSGDPHDLDLNAVRALAHEAATASRHSLLGEAGGVPVYVVPLGPSHNRQGTLCVDGRSIAANAARRAGLVGAAAAVLSVMFSRTDRSVQRVVVELLLAGDEALARRLCAAATVELPGQVVAVALAGPRRREAARRVADLGAWLVPTGSRHLTVLMSDPALASTRIAGLVEQTGARVGVSAQHVPRDLARAVQEAQSSLALASVTRPVVDFHETASSRLSGVLDSHAAGQLALDLLSPLGSHPDRETLLTSAASWLQAHARWDPAAAALGIHRETLRGRMSRLAQILGLDLNSFHDRLALSLALEAVASSRTQTDVPR
jgi:purine catabolism regulator